MEYGFQVGPEEETFHVEYGFQVGPEEGILSLWSMVSR